MEYKVNELLFTTTLKGKCQKTKWALAQISFFILVKRALGYANYPLRKPLPTPKVERKNIFYKFITTNKIISGQDYYVEIIFDGLDKYFMVESAHRTQMCWLQSALSFAESESL